jgi:hypothetical protein
MNDPAKIILRKCVCAAGLLALAGLVSGCKTTFRTADARFMAQPAEHRRVQIFPLWFEGAGDIDHTVTTNDLQALCRQAGEKLSTTVQETLLSKGYQVVGPVCVLSDNENLSRLNAETRLQLEAVRIDFCNNLLRLYSSSTPDKPLTFRTNSTLGFFRYMATPDPNRAMMERNPFHYQMAPALANLAARLGATNADAILLVDTKVFFESQHNRTKRVIWNYTGGGLIAVTEAGINLALLPLDNMIPGDDPPSTIWADPFWRSGNSLQQSMALVDVRTREVLWLNRQSFKHKDPRDAKVLEETLTDTLADLP